MVKKLFAVSAALGLLAVGVPVGAVPPGLDRGPAAVGSSGTEVVIPPHAVQVADGVFSLGSAIDPASREVVWGYAFVRKEARARGGKPDSVTGSEATCYKVLADGAKWKATEPWLVNPANVRGLPASTIFTVLAAGIGKWEDAADGAAGGGSVDILGNGTVTSAKLKADFGRPDNKNEAYFANVSSPGAIAITVVWGIWSGDLVNRKIVEWDQVYDDRDYDWSALAGGVAGKMDFDNIATHELGHSVGMGDIYDEACSFVTMYGYAGFGETIKRTLEAADILGVSTLY